MSDDTNGENDEEHAELEQSEGGTMGSNLTSEEGEIKYEGVDSGYDDTGTDTDGEFYQDDDDDTPVIEQSSGETLKSDDSDSISESDALEVGGGDSGYGDDTDDRS